MATNAQMGVPSAPVTDPRRRIIRGGDDPSLLLEELAAENFEGPRTRRLLDDLWLLGWDAGRGLIRSGKISGVRIGHPHMSLAPSDRQLLHESPELREALVLDALEVAPPTFVDHLRHGRWSPDRGASLSTYFIGTFASAFWRAYEQWVTSRHREQQLLRKLAAFHYAGPSSISTEHVAELREALRVLMSSASLEERLICSGLLQGHSQAEIGSTLGVSERAVEGRLRRLRGRAFDLVDQGLIEAPQGSRRRTRSKRTSSTAPLGSAA